MKNPFSPLFLFTKKIYQNKLLTNLIKIFFTLLILYILFGNINLRLAFQNLKHIRWAYLSLNIILSLTLLQFLMTGRLKLFLNFNGVKINFWKLMQFHYISLFFQVLLPSSIGSDAVKIYYLRNKSRISRLSLIIIMSRFIGVFTILLTAGFCLLFSRTPLEKDLLLRSGTIKLAALFLILLMGICLWTKPFTWLNGISKHRYKLLKYFSLVEGVYDRRTLLQAMFYSLFIQGITVLSFLLFYMGIDITLPLLKSFIYIPVTQLFTFIIPSMNGMGVREYFLYGFFQKEVFNLENMFLISVQMFLTSLVPALAGGILYFFKKREEN
ncbi:MAG: lysylphosphatidylglycerol synthase transmembrane domain-containing protein [bacterium]|nr:lysylphosphatidylglycerol synthase transmembrane domain-containing protein [bacterium]